MYKIGDNVVYGSNGVMTVIDIREEMVGDAARSYYVLKAPVGHRDSLTFVPVDNEKLVEAMRPLLSREELIYMISYMDSVPEAEWIKDNRARSDKYKKIIESGDRDSIIAMIKAICASGVRREEEGKKNFLADEALMHKAEHVLYSEFACVFGIPEEDVPAFIVEQKEKLKTI